MNFLLTSELEDRFEYEGKTIHLGLAFDNVLRMFEVFNHFLFSSYEKIDIALEILIKEYDLIEDMDIQEKNALLLFIMNQFLGIDTNDNQDSTSKKVFDFQQDAGIIYASFMNCYHIDLIEQQGKLHWMKFIQLFNHLDDKSKFKEVVNIRKMPMPKQEKGNEEYRKQIAEMKRIYALDKPKTEEDSQEKINKVFDSLANTFKK